MTPTSAIDRRPISRHCRDHFTRFAFNLVEVVLAMLVIAIGILSIVGLIPVGATANQRAVAANQGADAADQYLNYFAAHCQKNWSAVVLSDAYLPTNPAADPNLTDGNASDRIADMRCFEPGAASDVDVATLGAANMDLDSGTDWEVMPGTTNLFRYKGNPARNGVYRIIQKTDVNGLEPGGEVVDFDALVRMWKSPTTAYEWNGTTFVSASDIAYDKRVQLNIELSWPAQLPYKARGKATYAIEIFNPN